MQTRIIQVPCQRLARPLIAALAAAASTGAWADEPSPWYIGASQSLTHDSNVHRRPDGPSDTYSSTGLLGGFDQGIGRQRVYGNADVRYNKYQDESTLDNTSYRLRAGWDWATIEKLSGNFNVNASQSLANQDGNTLQPTSARDTIRAQQFGASVRWGGDGLLSLQGDYVHSRLRYSAPESLSSESDGDSGSAGVFYRLGADLRVGSALRFTRTESPYAIALTPTPTGPNDYRSNTRTGRNLDFLVDWRYSAQTAVNARLSWTRQENSEIEGRDFSGLTGSLAASYAPTAKLAFSASLSRDAGSNVSPFTYTGTTTGTAITGPLTVTINGLTQTTRTTDIFALGATYAATAKISAKAAFLYRHGKLLRAASVTGTTTTVSEEQSDTLRRSSLGVDYAVARNWLLACSVSHDSRSLSGTGGYAYDANVVGCSAQFTLR